MDTIVSMSILTKLLKKTGPKNFLYRQVQQRLPVVHRTGKRNFDLARFWIEFLQNADLRHHLVPHL